MIATLASAIGLFVATNLDELVVLVALFADPRFRARDVWLGQLVGAAALIALALAGSLLGLVVRTEFLGVLGAVPIVLGITKLIDRDDDDPHPRGGNRVLAVVLVAMASGGDNVGAYVPIFATRSRGELAAIVAVFAALTVAMCWLCRALVGHPRVKPHLQTLATWVTPLVFIVLGVVIFVDSGAYDLVVR